MELGRDLLGEPGGEGNLSAHSESDIRSGVPPFGEGDLSLSYRRDRGGVLIVDADALRSTAREVISSSASNDDDISITAG